jgi:hypothetical protein
MTKSEKLHPFAIQSSASVHKSGKLHPPAIQTSASVQVVMDSTHSWRSSRGSRHKPWDFADSYQSFEMVQNQRFFACR